MVETAQACFEAKLGDQGSPGRAHGLSEPAASGAQAVHPGQGSHSLPGDQLLDGAALTASRWVYASSPGVLLGHCSASSACHTSSPEM